MGKGARGEGWSYSQVGRLPLLDVLAFSAGGGFLAAQLPGDAHEQATLPEEEAADVHHDQNQQQAGQT